MIGIIDCCLEWFDFGEIVTVGKDCGVFDVSMLLNVINASVGLRSTISMNSIKEMKKNWPRPSNGPHQTKQSFERREKLRRNGEINWAVAMTVNLVTVFSSVYGP